MGLRGGEPVPKKGRRVLAGGLARTVLWPGSLGRGSPLSPVLVVGEDAAFRRFVRITLQRAGYAVEDLRVAAGSAVREATAVVYDCPLGDPGTELLARLGEATPVLWVTSGLSEERPQGPWVLVKPFDPGELVGLLERMLLQPVG